MTAESVKPANKPTKTRKRKINTTKVITLYNQGVIPSDIAKNQGVALSTITRYLQSIKPQLQDIQTYSGMKADALCLSQLKLQTVSNTILDKWINDPELISNADVRLQKEVLVAVQGAKSYELTAERLERGMSSENIQLIHADIAKIKGIQKQE
jgi:hypothetical protein